MKQNMFSSLQGENGAKRLALRKRVQVQRLADLV